MRALARAAFLAAALILVGAGCADADTARTPQGGTGSPGGTPPPSEPSPPAGTPSPSGKATQGEVTVKHGGLLDLPPRLTFKAVEGDSRCPSTVTCVWAGDATVVLSTDGRTYELHANSEPKSVTVDGRTVELVRLDPYPKVPGKIDPGSYQVTLKIT